MGLFSIRLRMQNIWIMAVLKITNNSMPVSTNISDWCLYSLSLKPHSDLYIVYLLSSVYFTSDIIAYIF